MNYRNAHYIDATRIDCEIEHSRYGWIPYTLDPNDTDMSVDNDELLERMTLVGDVAAYIPPTQSELDNIAGVDVRAERNNLLISLVDPLAGNSLRWAELTDDKQQEWVTYRRSLLDITDTEGFPHSVIWPTSPT
tara:strand:+ start:33 stop:434 length:402 start_codon:yes stop_codon:yes gene_type:complete